MVLTVEVEEWCKTRGWPDVTVNALLGELGLPEERRHQNACAESLRRLGYTKARLRSGGGERRHTWHRGPLLRGTSAARIVQIMPSTANDVAAWALLANGEVVALVQHGDTLIRHP